MLFKRHRDRLIASLSLSAVLLFSGCKATPPGTSSSLQEDTSIPAQSAPASSAETAAPPLAVSVQNLTMLSTAFGLGTGCSAESGYYEIDFFQSPAIVTYTDYAACQRVPLCARPECTHSDESCSAVVPGASGLVCLDGHLFVFTETEEGKRSIVRLNEDGSGRETVAELNGSDAYRSAFAGAQDSLFTVAQSYHAEDHMQTPDLIRIDLASGALQTLERLDPSRNWYLVGAFGETLLLKSIEHPGDAPEGSQEAYREQRHTLFLYTVSTGQWTTLSSWKQDDILNACYGDLLFLYDPAKAAFSVERLHADSAEVILAGDPLPVGEVRDAFFYGFYDGRVVVEMGENIAPEGDVPEYRWRMFAVSAQDGSVAELTLQQTYQGVDEFIRPIAQANGRLLVKYGVREESRTAEGPDGSLERYNTIVPVYAMIDSADFFSNTPRFQEIS